MNNDSRIPNKVIPVRITSVESNDSWPYDDGSPFWAGGSTPRPYRWEVVAEVTTQRHSSNITREPYEYNGLDIFVNNYVVYGTSGNIFKIVSVKSKDETSATFIVEDTYRYNTFKDSNQMGDGRPFPGGYAVFELSDEGMPLLDPFPGNVLSLSSLPSAVNGRFRRYDTSRRIDISEPNHSFEEGDVISVTEHGYEETTSENASSTFGKVVEAGSNPVTFSIITNNKILINTTLRLPGKLGSFLYADKTNPGKLTDVKNGPAIYLRVSDEIMSISNGTGSSVSSIGDTMNINGIDVSFTSTDISTIVSDINNLTNQHGVIAGSISSVTTAISNIPDAAYGGVFIGVPGGTATFNGVLVSFTTTTSGGSYCDATDAANDINSANIPNITASNNGGRIQLLESSGASIIIVNGTNDSFGNPIAGPGSATGLPLSTPASTDTFISLTHPDGFPITLKNVVGTPKDDLGLTSVDNGSPVYLMPVTGGVAKSEGTIVVPDIAGRDNLDTPTVGQLVYVVDSDDGNGNNVGEWSMFVWDGDKWILTADEDSAATDASSSSITLTTTSPTSNLIKTMSDGSRVTIITVEVITEFDDVSSSLVIEGQNSADTEILMGDDMIDLSSVGTYGATTDILFSGGGDISVNAIINPNSSTVGEVEVTISYQ